MISLIVWSCILPLCYSQAIPANIPSNFGASQKTPGSNSSAKQCKDNSIFCQFSFIKSSCTFDPIISEQCPLACGSCKAEPNFSKAVAIKKEAKSECKDTNLLCSLPFMKFGCTTDPRIALQCQKSCGMCIDEPLGKALTDALALCTDFSDNCSEDDCKQVKTKLGCMQTCGICDMFTQKLDYKKVESGKCEDHFDICKYDFINSFACNNSAYQEICPQSCNACEKSFFNDDDSDCSDQYDVCKDEGLSALICEGIDIDLRFACRDTCYACGEEYKDVSSMKKDTKCIDFLPLCENEYVQEILCNSTTLSKLCRKSCSICNVSKEDECKDKDEIACNNPYAVKYACKYSPKFQQKCPVACGICTPDSSSTPSASDKGEVCKDSIDANCTDPKKVKYGCKYNPMMRKECPATCGLCKSGELVSASPNAKCKDSMPFCKQLLMLSPKSCLYLGNTCKKSCGLCEKSENSTEVASIFKANTKESKSNTGGFLGFLFKGLPMFTLLVAVVFLTLSLIKYYVTLRNKRSNYFQL